MKKIKTQFFCTECGAQSPKWVGKCPSCEAWNTIVEEKLPPAAKSGKRLSWALDISKSSIVKPILMDEISTSKVDRVQSFDPEFNRVMGGGVVPGSVTLIGGNPGIGKSTLLLQIALNWKGISLYVSGEESNEQIKIRAERLGGNQQEIFLLAETYLERILEAAAKLQPSLLVIDSIQTVFSGMLDSIPGSISQVRECTAMCQRFAKETHIPIIIIGHINKDGAIAGPKVLEHIVDTVLQFEGDRHHVFRLLRTLKNRFGSTDELGIYEMLASGLKVVANPSQLWLTTSDKALSGNAVGATLEGQRTILIETQALVSDAVYGTPQRSTTGFDLRRLHMLLAVLEKRCGLFFGQSDVFLNIAGGIRVTDPAIDLSVIASLISSLENITIPASSCFAGEVGLSGEIRSVNRLEQRILEAERLGFEEIFVSKFHKQKLDFKPKSIKVKLVANINELYENAFV